MSQATSARVALMLIIMIAACIDAKAKKAVDGKCKRVEKSVIDWCTVKLEQENKILSGKIEVQNKNLIKLETENKNLKTENKALSSNLGLLDCIVFNKPMCAPNCPTVSKPSLKAVNADRPVATLPPCQGESLTFGATRLNDFIYVMCHDPTDVHNAWTIEVYNAFNATTYTKSDEPIPDVQSPMAFILGSMTCAATSQLYACSSRQCKKYDVTSRGQWTQWITVSKGGLISLSVTSDCGALAVIYTRGIFTLHVYNASGIEQLQSLPIPPDTRYALATPNGGFLISHDDYVSQLNAAGQTIRSYKGEGSDASPTLSERIQLMLDPRTGRIFVYDLNNNRVVLLECDLSDGKVLIDKKGVSIKGLSYDANARQLMVAYQWEIGTELYNIN